MTNSPNKPEFEGQISVFQSPHHTDVLLVDIAEYDNYGHLTWRAIPHESMLYIVSIQKYLDGEID